MRKHPHPCSILLQERTGEYRLQLKTCLVKFIWIQNWMTCHLLNFSDMPWAFSLWNPSVGRSVLDMLLVLPWVRKAGKNVLSPCKRVEFITWLSALCDHPWNWSYVSFGIANPLCKRFSNGLSVFLFCFWNFKMYIYMYVLLMNSFQMPVFG